MEYYGSVESRNLNNGEIRQIQICAHIVDECLHILLIRVHIVLRRRIALPLVPQQRLDLAAAARRLRALHHVLVQVLPTRPLLDRRPADGAGHQPDRPHALLHCVGERHPRPHAARLLRVDVVVERLTRHLPAEVGI